ncbi:MAG: hypothetical protein M3P29_04415 [Acidobacteriota bacterium]|nr:hypothetical protein [Acidobacteriota bacterium]
MKLLVVSTLAEEDVAPDGAVCVDEGVRRPLGSHRLIQPMNPRVACSGPVSDDAVRTLTRRSHRAERNEFSVPAVNLGVRTHQTGSSKNVVIHEQDHVASRLPHACVARSGQAAVDAEIDDADLLFARPPLHRFDRSVPRSVHGHDDLVLAHWIVLFHERSQSAFQQAPPVVRRDDDGHLHELASWPRPRLTCPRHTNRDVKVFAAFMEKGR